MSDYMTHEEKMIAVFGTGDPLLPCEERGAPDCACLVVRDANKYIVINDPCEEHAHG